MALLKWYGLPEAVSVAASLGLQFEQLLDSILAFGSSAYDHASSDKD